MSTELIEKTTTFIERPSGVSGLRARAWDAFERQGVPSTKHEEWKYTNLRTIAARSWSPAQESEISGSELAAIHSGECQIVLVNGRWNRELSSNLQAIDGLTVTDLQSEKFGQAADIDSNPFAALNTALAPAPITVHIARNAKIEQPIRLVHLTDARNSGDTIAFPRLLIVVEEGAEVEVVETYASIGANDLLCCPVTEVFVSPNAKLEHVRVQRENLAGSHIALTQVRQAADSTYVSFNIVFGGKLTRNDFNVYLDGENTHCRMDGVVAINGEQHVDNHTRLDHAHANCDSFEVYKHVLDEKAVAVFNGKIFVHQDAQKTDAKQSNQALLLSREATMNSKPQLEIFADDVKCTHGATIGQVREDAMFYLRARGIPEDEARGLMVYAFAAEVLEKIGIESIRNELETMLFQKLGN